MLGTSNANRDISPLQRLSESSIFARLHHSVPVQPEMERRRFPLVGKFRPSGGDFQGMGVYRSDVFGEERER